MKLFSKIYGDKGLDLIVIHGLFGMSDNWNALGKKIAKNCKVHLIDLRNHGRSPHSDDFNYDVMCEDLLEYMEDNNIQKPILLGHSLGGKVAIKFAFTYPEKIEKLIVADISPRKYNTDFSQKFLQFLYKLPLENFERREEIDNLLSSTYKDKGIRHFLLKNLYRKKNKELAWRFNIDILLEQVSNIQEADFIKGVCDIPTYFIKGEYSNYINKDDKRLIREIFSEVNIFTINNVGHFLHTENPEEFCNIILDILK